MNKHAWRSSNLTRGKAYICGRLIDCLSRSGASLHVCMSPHGPDMASFAAASSADTAVPQRLPSSTMAFMFEVSQTPQVMHSALNCSWREIDYQRCWAGFQQANVSKRKAGSHDNGHATDSRVQKRAVQAEVISSG